MASFWFLMLGVMIGMAIGIALALDSTARVVGIRSTLPRAHLRRLRRGRADLRAALGRKP